MERRGQGGKEGVREERKGPGRKESGSERVGICHIGEEWTREAWEGTKSPGREGWEKGRKQNGQEGARKERKVSGEGKGT